MESAVFDTDSEVHGAFWFNGANPVVVLEG